MKESGIDWIGQIPEEWEVTRIKNIASIERGASPRPIDKFISDDDTGVNWIRIGDTYKGNKYITSTRLKITNRGKQFSRYIHPGTLILSNSMSFGEPYISSIYGCIHDGWLSLTPYNNISKEYLYWLLLSDVCTSQFNLVSIGAVVENLSVDKVGNTLVSMPYSLSEQQKIADFLDKKTAQLDKAKALLEEQIQKLKDYRASLIYETVTKGLDKTVPMKDSGIDWIGQVPQGWGSGKVKYFSQVSAGATPDRNNSLFWNGNINWMSSGEVNQGIVKHTSETITDLALKRTSTKLLPNGTVMLALNGQGKTKGTAAVLAIESASNQSLASFIVDNKILNNMYLYYFFVANYYNIRGLKGEDRDGLNLQLVSNIVIPLFELEEQQKIVDFLDKKTVQIDKLIQIKNEQIKNINKQRQTLIYDYVTGKRRV